MWGQGFWVESGGLPPEFKEHDVGAQGLVAEALACQGSWSKSRATWLASRANRAGPAAGVACLATRAQWPCRQALTFMILNQRAHAGGRCGGWL